MTWNPHVTVAAVLEQNGEFLLVEEKIDGKICYNQPAGHWECGESLIDAVTRETLEETAYSFVPDYLIGIYNWHNPDKNISFLRFTFGGTISGHQPERALDTGIIAARWLSWSAIKACAAQHRSPMVLSGIEDYLAGKRYPARFVNALFMIKPWKTRWFLCFMFFTTLACAEERIAICYNYGCFSQAAAVYRDEQLRELGVLFSQVNNAAEERAVLADVVGRLFGWAGQQTPINADKGGNLADNAVDGKMDCIDHSLTTTRFLQMLEKRALLSFHRVVPRVLRRSFLIFEHYAAQIEEIAEGINDASDMAQQTPARYVVDAWFFDNGQPALVMPVEEWQAGGGPSVGQ